MQETLLDAMVEREGRLGRKNRKGFYDYPEKGPKTLWPGLAGARRRGARPGYAGRRRAEAALARIQALEAARAVEEGIVTDPREADVGSIIGFGFAPFTGGTLCYIDGMGAKAFVALCDALAAKHGVRFEPNALLRDMAAKGETLLRPRGGRPAAA